MPNRTFWAMQNATTKFVVKTNSTTNLSTALQSYDGDLPPWITILATHPWPSVLFGLAISLPSAILYFMEVLLIFRHWEKEFASSFYTLFTARAIISLIGWLGCTFYQKMGRMGLTMYSLYAELPSLLLAIFFFFYMYSFHMDNIGTAVMLLNRLTAILFPTRYEKIWKNGGTWIALALVCLFPLPFTYHILGLNMLPSILPDNLTFVVDNKVLNPNQPNDTNIAAQFSVIFTAICLGLNFACIFAYILKKSALSQGNTTTNNNNNHHHNHQNQLNSDLRWKLTVYAIVTFIGQLIYSVYMILINNVTGISFNYKSEELDDQLNFLAVYNQLSWVGDLCTLVLPAWLFLWVSPSIRKHLLGIYKKCSRFWQKTTLPTTSWGINTQVVQLVNNNNATTNITRIGGTNSLQNLPRHN